MDLPVAKEPVRPIRIMVVEAWGSCKAGFVGGMVGGVARLAEDGVGKLRCGVGSGIGKVKVNGLWVLLF